MRNMCGLEDTTGNKCFQKWYKDLFAEHQYEKDKLHVIDTAIEKCYIFNNAEVPLYPTLVKTIVRIGRLRHWKNSGTSKCR